MTQRDTAATLKWYAGHTTKSSIGFDPDGMCLKVCRTARNIGAKYPSAISAQLATPKANRITRLNDIQVGMVAYYDDPRDSNPYGHIVTVASRAAEVKSLADIVVWTNSVKANTLVKVKGDYFPRYWGDAFQFASNILNGVPLLLPKQPPKEPSGFPRLRHAIVDIEEMIKYHKSKNNTRLVTALQRDLAELKQTLKDFS